MHGSNRKIEAVPTAESDENVFQVREKWLRDRKREELGRAALQQYRAILVAVAETLSVMGEIDSVLW